MLLHVSACLSTARFAPQAQFVNKAFHTLSHMVSFAPDDTPEGFLPPWEIAKAFAFHTVLQKAAELLASTPSDLVGERVDDYIAKQLTLKGGGQPCSRGVRKVIARCREPAWYPGKPSDHSKTAGRKPIYTEHQKDEVARVAMDLKRKLIAPTPRRVRARLPEVTRRADTGGRMSKQTVARIFVVRCYDVEEDDPWQYLPCVSQDVLPLELLPLRVKAAKHILGMTTATSWRSHVAIDPCYSLLSKTQERLEEQKVAAMGKNRWQSKGARRIGCNLRGPATNNTQKGSNVTRVDWTPIFARGKVSIYVVEADAARSDESLPKKLADAANLAKFVRAVLPKQLEKMKAQHGWSDLPRVLVHDKASYMVTAYHERLHVTFAAALHEAGFRSWVGDSTEWLVKKFGDMYLHETVIAHIRRLLDNDFAANKLFETPNQFRVRMKKVEDHLNSDAFASPGGMGLEGLARELRARCEDMILRKGERLPK